MSQVTQVVLTIVFRVINNKKEFLLLHRLPNKGDFWQPPGGAVEADESVESAAYRELFEETSITKENVLCLIPEIHNFLVDTHYLTGKPINPISHHVFGIEVKPDVFISFENNVYPEHDDFQWVTYEEALQLLKWDNNKDAFNKLQDYFTSEETKG